MKRYLAGILVAAMLLVPGLCLAASTSFTVSATVLSKSICKFNTATATLAFGLLDPGNPVDVTASATFDFRCMGSAPVATFLITDDDGLNETGIDADRMRHTTDPTQYIPYSLALNPTTNTVPKNAVQVLTTTGTIFGADYQFAITGDYADTVTIDILP